MLDNEINIENSQKKKIKKGVYLLPNLITSASLFGGFYAIIASLDGNFEYAAIAIIISGILDGLDGRIARLTGSSSKFGVEYDSLADLIAFGLAPGVLVFTWALRPFGRYGWLAAFLYVVCGALRLARFNVQITTVESKRFNGLPIPAAAALVCTTVLMFFYIGRGEEMVKHVTVLVIVYALAFLMISNVHYYSFKEFSLSQRMPFRFLVGLIFLLIVVAANPQLMLFLLTFGYVASGPITTLIDRRRKINLKAPAKDRREPKEAGANR
ncbi:MAG TPA: CDP-diacylglycerol--serine O-phosphatidyltransferase [Deltaproteobacteria bacterium]|nr:MAG: CDP-diacylglycerol--serine O-phosphatidyltransferase [Deltaproteobacteria bacterium GWA2_55_82]OGQ63273.1 MAG: CDP-diacylglycerol--serine O-phosphatidyltransferase [Deltaproteobacteria bacterium RIFCSPLOWO2_02_FULL_55_12]OIJ73108.1 MAG: CDP-diacylglycerol--serine O-phosphatidyltransferase [Deltaproteobacteria bacterium GWC2_55_46]HBG47874.1 CDP-diacylglycerol--serine O-phosphatidyltransferase [Deltaproteobacteria bacterium]HCY11863.1 CDP-diacylglycerol--serine O-phosphatidyltransferase 